VGSVRQRCEQRRLELGTPLGKLGLLPLFKEVCPLDRNRGHIGTMLDPRFGRDIAAFLNR
jgi:hypothetical protein